LYPAEFNFHFCSSQYPIQDDHKIIYFGVSNLLLRLQSKEKMSHYYMWKQAYNVQAVHIKWWTEARVSVRSSNRKLSMSNL